MPLPNSTFEDIFWPIFVISNINCLFFLSLDDIARKFITINDLQFVFIKNCIFAILKLFQPDDI